MSGGAAIALERFRSRWPTDRAVSLALVGAHTDEESATLGEVCTRLGLRMADHSSERPVELVERTGADVFDYAHVGALWAELGDVERLTTLRVAERLASAGLVWTGTVRGLAGGAGTSRRCVLDAKKRLSLGWLEGRVPRLGGGFCLAGEHAGAWSGLGMSGGVQPDAM